MAEQYSLFWLCKCFFFLTFNIAFFVIGIIIYKGSNSEYG